MQDNASNIYIAHGNDGHRKVIEKVKGIVMRVRDLSESDAHKLLQRAATKNRQKLVELARNVCQAGDLLTASNRVDGI